MNIKIHFKVMKLKKVKKVVMKMMKMKIQNNKKKIMNQNENKQIRIIKIKNRRSPKRFEIIF